MSIIDLTHIFSCSSEDEEEEVPIITDRERKSVAEAVDVAMTQMNKKRVRALMFASPKKSRRACSKTRTPRPLPKDQTPVITEPVIPPERIALTASELHSIAEAIGEEATKAAIKRIEGKAEATAFTPTKKKRTSETKSETSLSVKKVIYIPLMSHC